MQNAINKLKAASVAPDENQVTFEKEGDYKEISEAFKAAYDVLKELADPDCGVTPALEAPPRSGAGTGAQRPPQPGEPGHAPEQPVRGRRRPGRQ